MREIQDKETIICRKLIDMMEEISFFDISVTSFVKYAGISRSTFYLYFSSMYDVLEKIENDFIDGLLPENEIGRSMRKKRKNQIDGSIITKTEYIRENKKLLRVLTSEKGDPAFMARLVNRSRRILRKSLQAGDQFDEQQRKLLAEYISAGQIQALKWWVRHDDEMDIYDLSLFMEKLTFSLLDIKNKIGLH